MRPITVQSVRMRSRAQRSTLRVQVMGRAQGKASSYGIIVGSDVRLEMSRRAFRRFLDRAEEVWREGETYPSSAKLD